MKTAYQRAERALSAVGDDSVLADWGGELCPPHVPLALGPKIMNYAHQPMADAIPYRCGRTLAQLGRRLMNHTPISIAETMGARYGCRLPMAGATVSVRPTILATVPVDPR